MAILTTFFTSFGCTLRVVLEVPTAVLTAFFTCFRGFFTVLCEIT